MAQKIDNITSVPDIVGTPRMSEVEIRDSIDHYYRNVVAAAKTPPHGGTLMHFFELVQNAIWSREASDGISENKRLTVLAEDPPEEEEINTEAITFFLEDRDPAIFGRQTPTSRGSNVREHGFHKRSEQQHPEHVGEKLITMGRGYDNVIIFNLYAKTNKQVLNRIFWFETVMDNFRWYFRLHYFNPFEVKVRRIGNVKVGKKDLVKYSMYFFVKSEDIYQFGTQELKKLVLNLNMTTN
jgi:hypothetical protein